MWNMCVCACVRAFFGLERKELHEHAAEQRILIRKNMEIIIET